MPSSAVHSWRLSGVSLKVWGPDGVSPSVSLKVPEQAALMSEVGVRAFPSPPFCSGQALRRLVDAHSLWGGPSALLCTNAPLF